MTALASDLPHETTSVIWRLVSKAPGERTFRYRPAFTFALPVRDPNKAKARLLRAIEQKGGSGWEFRIQGRVVRTSKGPWLDFEEEPSP